MRNPKLVFNAHLGKALPMLPTLRLLLLLLAFSAGLRAAEVYEPKAGSPERAAIMEAMRAPITKKIGKRVTFTGQVRVSGVWAVFHGNAAPSDGKPPKGDAAIDLELDLFALLRFSNGAWTAVHWGFAGDIGVMEEAREKFPKVPKALFDSLLSP